MNYGKSAICPWPRRSSPRARRANYRATPRPSRCPVTHAAIWARERTPQLAPDILHMRLRRPRRNRQAPGDSPVGQPPGDQFGHLQLTAGQPRLRAHRLAQETGPHMRLDEVPSDQDEKGSITPSAVSKRTCRSGRGRSRLPALIICLRVCLPAGSLSAPGRRPPVPRWCSRGRRGPSPRRVPQ